MNSVAKTNSNEGQPICFVSTIPKDYVVDSKVSRKSTTLTSACQKTPSSIMPISAGYVDGEKSDGIGDTGCSGIVIRKGTVSEKSFISGKEQICILADGSKVTIPIAKVYIDTSYLKEWCMGKPFMILLLLMY